MGYIVIGAYKPNAGKTKALAKMLETHVDSLRLEGFATARNHILMQAKDGTFIEIYEWVSANSHQMAIRNTVISGIWGEMDKICTYIPASRVPELDNLFSEFIPKN